MLSPFDVGLWYLCRLRFLYELRIPIRLVRETSLREDEERHCCDEREEEG